MKTVIDKLKYETEATVSVNIRDVLDIVEPEDIFSYLVTVAEKQTKVLAKEFFGLEETG